ncbi:hypothetical protein MTR_3g091030 [Medicago truncatula]|uniref:Uncharacterized protein n=1 Tax=Medicago truncatula TaxID=3880 RepID=G7J6S9_MEDTR|nr:hypothetical protein MTR_3g091030 [Medicago truncatula]
MCYVEIDMLGQRGESGGPSTLRLEQPHKQKRRHTLTQNLKVMGFLVHQFIMLPFKRKRIAVHSFSANGPTLLCTAVAALCADGLAASILPFVEWGYDTTIGSLGELGGTAHIEARTTTQARETPHSYPKP